MRILQRGMFRRFSSGLFHFQTPGHDGADGHKDQSFALRFRHPFFQRGQGGIARMADAKGIPLPPGEAFKLLQHAPHMEKVVFVIQKDLPFRERHAEPARQGGADGLAGGAGIEPQQPRAVSIR